MNSDALLCSNTSTLPITELAEGVNRPDDFIGLHFFSPSTRCRWSRSSAARKTTDEAVAKALDVVHADPQDPDRGQRQPRLLHQPRHRHDGDGGPRHARRGRPPDVGRAGRDPGRLPGRHAAALRRAEHGADGQDRRRPPPTRRRRRLPAAPGRGRGREDARGGPPGPPARQGLLRVRRERRPRLACGRAWPSCSRRTPSRPTSRTSRTATCSSRRSRPRSASRRASSSPPPRPTSARSWASATPR